MHISFHRPHLKRVENLNASDEDHLVCSTKSYQRNARVFSLFRLHHHPAQYSVDICLQGFKLTFATVSEHKIDKKCIKKSFAELR